MDQLANPLQKARRINQEPQKFGTFAEIGAGQEVVRWFFRAGKASATVAKSISAYDTAVSDDLYGPTRHYVSRERVESMLNQEYQLLRNRHQSRSATSCFFVFADTIATHHGGGGHGWIGFRFQGAPGAEPSEVLAHIELLDLSSGAQQKAVGILGVNLIHGASFHSDDPPRLIGSLRDALRPGRIEVDLIKFSGPAFGAVDNRLMSLQLVEQELTNVALFTVDGEVEQASEVLFGKPVLLERGAFRPVTNVTRDMLDCALQQFCREHKVNPDELMVLMEMTMNNLMNGRTIDPQDFLARVDTISALGKVVMITKFARFDGVVRYLRKYTANWIALALGAPTLIEIFDGKYYADVEGGILEGLGGLFRDQVKLYVYPMKTGAGEALVGADNLSVPAESQRLYEYVREKGQVEAIREFQEDQLHLYPSDVLDRIRKRDPSWETLVPPQVAQIIKRRKLFGYQE